ncbi:ATP-binding protein [Nocardioides baekrokdamisoli]|nr:LuxR C-terminal-related transcriptional regulator [Nocardioides baekrokdamisoli]
MSATTRTYSLTPFIGRSQETRDVRALVEQHRLINLVGPGGVGKTRLAYEVFDQLAVDLDDAAWTVELADLSDAGLLGHAVAEAVGASVLAEGFDPRMLVRHISDRTSLLLIDNCEHMVPECAALITAVLQRCRNLRVITTSRHTLGVVGEQLYTVPPLIARDGLELFTARALAVAPSWTPGEHDRSAIIDMCSRLDGVAFAIELAASRMRTVGLEALGAEIEDQLAALVSTSASSGRHISMEACLRWGHDLCTPGEQLLWERLSVFAGTFTLQAARGVCEAADLSADEVDDALRGLADKSLIERDVHDRAGRYRMLEVVRQFGAARLAEKGELDLWHRRHCDHYLAMVDQFDAEWLGPDQVEWFQQLRTEQANLRLAFEYSVSHADHAASALRMCALLEHYVGSTGGASEALHWLRKATAQPTGAVVERAEALRVGCFVACVVGALDTAQRLHDDLLALSMGSDDARVRGCALYARAVLAAWSNDAPTGERVAQEAISVFQELGDTGRVANLHFLRALMLGWAHRPDDAAECYRECFALTQPLGERYWTSYAQWGLGVDMLLSGSIEESVQLEREALETKALFGDALGTALALEALAWAAVDRADGPLAAFLDAAADTIWTTLGVPLAGMPYLLRRRDQSRAALSRMSGVSESIALLGRTLPLAQIVEVAVGRAPLPSPTPQSNLTPREWEIATFLARGDTNQVIADHLVISRRTVESHVDRVLRKLGVSSRTEVRDALALR